jgi:hypothetical protein
MKHQTVTAEEVRAIRRAVETLDEELRGLRIKLYECQNFLEGHKHKTFTGKAYLTKDEV